jgi:hypothetical protein
MGVSQIVQADGRQAGGMDVALELLAEPVGVQRGALLVVEHQVVVQISPAPH